MGYLLRAPTLIITLQQLYKTSGDSEAYSLSTLPATYTGVASVMFLSEVLDILARMNASMQRKLADFSKLPVLLKVTIDQLEQLKKEKSERLCSVESEDSLLKEKHDTNLGTHGSARSHWSSITTIAQYQALVTIPYVNALLECTVALLLSTNYVTHHAFGHAQYRACASCIPAFAGLLLSSLYPI